MKNNTVNILGFNFFNGTFNHFINTIKQRIHQHQNTFVVTANPEIIVHALDDSSYAKQINQADFLVPDGIGIVLGAKMLNQEMSERITGYDILLDLLQWGNDNHKSAYFVGAKPEVIKDLKKVIHERYPHLKAVGFHDGYFNNNQTVINNIVDKQPEMVFVALGFPKQEEFILQSQKQCSAFWMGVGGSFDVLSGHTVRAPKFWINHHIEWLYRLIKEPSRFKRMLALPKFIYLITKQRHNTNMKH